MAGDASTQHTPGPFDVRTIRHLTALMSQHDLSEIYLRDGDRRVRLRRGPRGVTVTTAAAPGPVPAPVVAAQPPAAAEAPRPAAPARPLVEIKSETPGTFYARPNPDAEPYVRVGSPVTPATVVCQIEAMKIFNEVTANCTGTVVEIAVENQQPVEYGQVLFRVDPTA